ncbi:MAG: hypothetical protein R6V36_03045 [Psychroflexus sp.]
MKYFLFTSLMICLVSCQNSSENNAKTEMSSAKTEAILEENINQEFWDRISKLKGEAFEGVVIEAPDGDDFRGKRLLMHVLDVKKDTIYIPFNVGDNRSRTWILTKTNDGIQLKHDHRKEDGSDDEVTMYGGVTPNTGFDGLAMFPADQETVDLLPGTATNLWWITIDDKKFTYNLRRIGSSVKFSIGFDLESPIDKPEPSWGWENYKSE